MSASWSWKSDDGNAIVRKTDDGLLPGGGTGTVVSIDTTAAPVLNASAPVLGSVSLSYSGTALPISSGGTNRTSVPTLYSASTYSAWDANNRVPTTGFSTFGIIFLRK